MVEPEARSSFTLETWFNSSLNRFGDQVLGTSQSLHGRIFNSSKGHQVGGAFKYTFPLMDVSTYDPMYLAAVGVFGATQTSFRETGEAPKTTTGFAHGLVDDLMAATAGFPGAEAADLMAFARDNDHTYEIIAYAGDIGSAQPQESVAVDKSPDGIVIGMPSWGIVASERVSFGIDPDDLADADANATLVTVKRNTGTRGEIAVTLSRPDSAAYGLDYAGFGFWALEEPTGAAAAGLFVYGTPTTATEALPTSGTATYRGMALATAVDSMGRVQQDKTIYGTVTGDSRLDVDFAASSVELTLDNLNMRLHGDGSVHKLPTLNGKGAIGDAGFSGQFSGTAFPFDNRFAGNFYGPNSPLPPEVAGAWKYLLTNPQDAGRNLDIQGVFTGKR